MYLSKQFLNSVVKGFGFATGTLISLHLYTMVFNEEIKEQEIAYQTKSEENNEQIKKPLEIEQQNLEFDEQNIGFLCRIFRSYCYYI
jgi:hypothetical protein